MDLEAKTYRDISNQIQERLGIDAEEATPKDLYDAGLPDVAKAFSDLRGEDALAGLSQLVGSDSETGEDLSQIIDAQIAPDERIGREPSGPGALEVPHVIVGPEGGVAKLEESSGTRWSALGQLKMETGLDRRVCRYELVLPPERSPIRPSQSFETERAEKVASVVAQPRNPGKLSDEDLALFQRSEAWKRMNQWLAQCELTPVQSDAETSLVGPLNSVTITAMDTELVWDFAQAGREEVHYVSNLFSGGGYLPGTDKPDYRKVEFVALEPEILSAVTEFLGLGKTVDPEADRELIIDGHSPLVLPEDFDWESNLGWLKDRQFRAITGHENLTPGEAPEGELSLSKGVARCIHPTYVQHVLALHEQGKRVSEAAYELVLEATRAERPTIFLAKGDQVKVGGQRMAGRGEALVTSTFLTGTLGEEGELPPRQFPDINGGPQFAQFLTAEGFEKLLRHLHVEAAQLAEKVTSVEGIGQLISEEAERQRRQILRGERKEISASANLLESALAGSGIIEQSDATLERMEGQSPSSSNVFMLDTVKRRADRVVASEAKWIVESLGMSMVGTLNFTCENSEDLVRSIWHTDRVPDGYFEASGQELPPSPVADPSGQVLPLKVIQPLGADDDGDIVLGWAANIEVGGQEAKVIANGRYPNVDAPVFWAMEAGTPTPFDARSEEEEQRFKRMLKLFGPEWREDQPALQSDGITRLRLGDAYELSETGAKSAVDTSKAKGPAERSSAIDLVKKQASLTQAGQRTRDLERFLHAAQEARTEIRSGQPQGGRLARLESAHSDALEKAGDSAVSCEGVLTAHKHENMQDLSNEPTDGLEVLGYFEYDDLVELLPLDYHDEVSGLDSILFENRKEGHCLQMWDGPAGSCRMAGAIRHIIQGPLQDVVENFQEVQTDPRPFLDRLEKRAPEDPSEKLRREADFALRTCDFYRDFWSDLLDANEHAIQAAVKREEAERRVEKRTATASRQITRLLEFIGSGLSTDALALALKEDWEPDVYQNGGGELETYHPSKGAGLAMAGRRLAGVFHEDVEVRPLQSSESHCVVYRTGEDLPPAPKETQVVRDIGIDREGRRIVFEGEDGDMVALQVAEGAELPPDAVASGNYKCRLTALTARRGVIRWIYDAES